MLANHTGNCHKRYWGHDKLKVAGVASFGLVLTFATFFFWHHREYNQVKDKFKSTSTQVAQVVSQEMRMRASIIATVRAFYDASRFVSRDEFTLATEGFLDRYDDVRAFAWAPLIDQKARSKYETQTRKEGVEDFQISEIGPTGKPVKRSGQKEYLPISYIEPYAGNELLMGFDLASNEKCLSIILKCRDSGQAAMMYLPQFQDEHDTEHQFCIVIPVFDPDGISYTVAGRRECLQGYVLGVFYADVLLNNSLGLLLPEGFGISFIDKTDKEDTSPFCAGVMGQMGVASVVSDASTPKQAIVRDEEPVFLGRQWQVSCWATPAFVSSHRAWSTWVILPVGLSLTIMITQLTSVQLSRTRQVEKEVAIRTAELDRIHRELVLVSRKAGMSEIATGVLHNVGNILNSVNVAANIMAEKVQKSRINELEQAGNLLAEHVEDMASFVSVHPQGRHMAQYFIEISKHLADSRRSMITDLNNLCKNVEHIKEIVAMQQSYAKVSGVMEELDPIELIEEALRIRSVSFDRHHIDVVREYREVPRILTDRHKVMQIVVNLVDNAKQAVSGFRPNGGTVSLRLFSVGNDRVRLEVSDDGRGIIKENLSRVFNYGFTTKKDGHGFGLHTSALAAKEMGGSLSVHSDGEGDGATFSLELPMRPPKTADANHAPDNTAEQKQSEDQPCTTSPDESVVVDQHHG